MTTHLIPLGMRCSAAQITNAIVSQPRFPFDWVQMNAESMRDVIHLKPTEIRKFWTDYFSSIDDTKHTITGSWFPHDEFTDEEKEKTIDKYVRRTERLHSVLNLQSHVTYVIVFGFPEQDTIEKVLELTFAICCRQEGSCSFIICNGMIPEIEKENMTFIYEKLGELNGFQDWEDLTTSLEQRVRKILLEKQIKVIPFTTESK